MPFNLVVLVSELVLLKKSEITYFGVLIYDYMKEGT